MTYRLTTDQIEKNSHTERLIAKLHTTPLSFTTNRCFDKYLTAPPFCFISWICWQCSDYISHGYPICFYKGAFSFQIVATFGGELLSTMLALLVRL